MTFAEWINGLSDTQWLGGTAFLLMGIVGEVLIQIRNRTIKASQNWPSVKGKITRSSFFKPSSSMRHGADSHARADIGYYYIVHGRKYDNSRISITPYRYNDGELLKRFKEVDQVDVFYDPDKPHKAVLIIEEYQNTLVVELIVVLPFFLISLGFFMYDHPLMKQIRYALFY